MKTCLFNPFWSDFLFLAEYFGYFVLRTAKVLCKLTVYRIKKLMAEYRS